MATRFVTLIPMGRGRCHPMKQSVPSETHTHHCEIWSPPKTGIHVRNVSRDLAFSFIHYQNCLVLKKIRLLQHIALAPQTLHITK